MNGLVIFTTSTCGPCRMAKQWLFERGVPFQEVNLDQRPDMTQWMFQTTGQRTVPQFFMNGEWLSGGFMEVQRRFGG